MAALLVRELIHDLVEILAESGGSLGNQAARSLLSERAGTKISPEIYERIKDHLIATGIAKRGKGQGGSLVLLESLGRKTPVQAFEQLPPSEDLRAVQNVNQSSPVDSDSERIDDLYSSLELVPGLYTKKNRKTLAVYFGDDEDKLFAFWDSREGQFVLQYRQEKDKTNMTSEVKKIFARVSKSPGEIREARSSLTLSCGQTLASINHKCRMLRPHFDEITLDPSKEAKAPSALEDTYYREVAMLIKFYIDNDLYWPRKAWRKVLCFDDVDRLTVIGESGSARQNPWREHVVPVNLIRKEAEKLAREGAPVSVIADFIRHHLFVVLIHKDERLRLDEPIEKGGLGLRENMPEHWLPGDDPLERLSAAGIQITMARSLPRWTPWRRRNRDRLKEALIGRVSFKVS